MAQSRLAMRPSCWRRTDVTVKSLEATNATPGRWVRLQGTTLSTSRPGPAPLLTRLARDLMDMTDGSDLGISQNRFVHIPVMLRYTARGRCPASPSRTTQVSGESGAPG